MTEQHRIPGGNRDGPSDSGGAMNGAMKIDKYEKPTCIAVSFNACKRLSMWP